MKSFFICFSLMFFALSGIAESDKTANGALKDTQDFLKDKKQREELFKTDPKAKGADARVQAVTGGNAAQSQKIYDISADAFGAVMKDVQNDPNKAMELLQKAQANPEAFYNSLPKEVREQIHGVAGEIEKKDFSSKAP